MCIRDRDSPEIHALESAISLEESSDTPFTVYEDVRQKLIDAGMPPEPVSSTHLQWIIKGLEPCKLAFGSVPCHGRFALSTGHRLAENHADAHFPVAGQEFSFVIAE